MPNVTVPTSVWDQIPVVVVFAFLLAGVGWLFVKAFKDAILDINKYYTGQMENNNKQWAMYSEVVNKQVVSQLADLTQVIKTMHESFQAHDQMERQVLDGIAKRAKPRAHS